MVDQFPHTSHIETVVLFEKSIDSQIKLKKLMDKEKKIYNENDKKNLDYLIENSE